MFKTVLVKKLVDDGARLLKALDARKFPVSAALWFFFQESMTWKLIIVSDVASAPGPREAYMQIQSAMVGLNLDLALDDITVMSPTSKNFPNFRRTIEGVAKVALLNRKPYSEGVSFEDAYIYRWLD
jgi:hypothetical protein